ncbi:MAG: phosphatidylinositol-specific phospholipase C domain-containing protein [Clostridia bacterium]|nr:phosphatidylinositol-specific phospholipase C domain-containing protein [Clostridia bacterium]
MNDWMQNIPDSFMICDINLPGTHDSCSKKVQFSYFSKCQCMSIFEQLNIGVRFIDVRVEKTGNRLKTVHGIADCYKPGERKNNLMLEDVIADCKAFLKANPTESVFFCLKRDDGGSSEDAFEAFFDNYLQNDDFWYTENRVPSMGEVRGKIVLLNRCCAEAENEKYTDFNCGINLSGWPDLPKSAEKTVAVVPIPRRNGKSTEAYLLQDMYKLSPKKKWAKAVKPLLENPPEAKGFFFNFLTAADFIHSPKKYAKYINKRYLKTDLSALTKYGWLIFDFPTEKMCRKIILTNF